MDLDDKSDEVRRRMARLRTTLEGDVESFAASARAVAENARTIADWRYLVRRFPFAVAGVAVVAGYVLIPRRKQVIVPDAETLAKMAKLNQVWVKTGSPKGQENERGVMGALVALAAGAASRYALNWATEQLKTTLGAAAAKNSAAAKEKEHAEPDLKEVEQDTPHTSKYPPR